MEFATSRYPDQHKTGNSPYVTQEIYEIFDQIGNKEGTTSIVRVARQTFLK